MAKAATNQAYRTQNILFECIVVKFHESVYLAWITLYSWTQYNSVNYSQPAEYVAGQELTYCILWVCHLVFFFLISFFLIEYSTAENPKQLLSYFICTEQHCCCFDRKMARAAGRASYDSAKLLTRHYFEATQSQKFRLGIAHVQFTCKRMSSYFLVMVAFEMLIESFSILSSCGSPLGGMSINLSSSTVTMPACSSRQ